MRFRPWHTEFIMPGTLIRLTILLTAVFLAVFWIRLVRRGARAEKKIQELNGELTRLRGRTEGPDAAKAEVIAIIVHQLRAPLAVVRDYAALFLEGVLGPSSALAQQSMEKVHAATEHLLGVVTDLFEFSRLEGEGGAYATEDIAVDAIVADAMRELEAIAKAKRIALHFQNRTGGRRAVRADAAKIRQAVHHLIDNALRYTSAGRVHVELVPETVGSRPWLRLSVQDTGIGIQSADISRLFEKFSRTEEARRIRPDGLGLGLWAVKKVVEAHGGEVGAESAGLGHGSTFWVRLPIAL
jgi:signal transduction histidine kinase